MGAPFEEPTKTDMRARCEVAVDKAGYELVEEVLAVDLPAGAGLHGRLKGDLQSLDGEGVRYCYYLVTPARDALPKWLANLASACHGMTGVKIYVVAESSSPSFEKSCRVAGAGLLLLSDDNEFQHIVDYDIVSPLKADDAFLSKIDRLRRSMESKLNLNATELQSRFENIGRLTRGMQSDVAEQYRSGIERQHRLWSEWADNLSRDLDAALADRDESVLESIERLIEEGPELDDEGVVTE